MSYLPLPSVLAFPIRLDETIPPGRVELWDDARLLVAIEIGEIEGEIVARVAAPEVE